MSAVMGPVVSGQPDSQTAPALKGKGLRKWLPLIGLVVLAWVLSRLDLEALGRVVSRVAVSTLILSCAWFSLNVWLKVWRWQRLLKAQGIELPHRVALPAYLSAQFYAQISIGRVGEFLRIEALTERGVAPGTALSSCVFDRLLDVLWVLFTGLSLGALWLGNVRVGIAAGVAMLAVLSGAASVFAVFARDEGWGARLLERVSSRRWAARVVAFARALVRGMLPMLRPRALLEAAAWTISAWGCYFAALFTLADGLHVDVSRLLLTATAAFAALSSLLPVTISGLGARELIYIQVLRSHGVPSESAVALSLLHLAVMTFTAIGVGLVGVAVRARQRRA